MAERLNLAMWSGPRNLSTALMRSFGNREDVIEVIDEPFYASYLKESNMDFFPSLLQRISTWVNDGC